ncbi:MAG: hypothetical protein AAGA99_02200 [Actinomycetota bacterium]
MTETTPTTSTSVPDSRRASHLQILLLALIALVAASCGGDDPPTTEGTPTSATPVDEELDEILPPGTHVGISWFAPPAPGTEDQTLALWEEANAEATIGRVMIDWIEVEPVEGDYAFTELEEQLRNITDRGALPMVTIVAVDVSGTPFPEWLGGFEPERAAEAYAGMLEAAAPILEEHDVWLLAVANEPPLEDDLDIGEFTEFVAGVEERADTLLPDIPVTFVFAGGDAVKQDPATRELAAAVDVFSLNHYCLHPDLLVIDAEDTASYLEESMVLAGDKPVVFQEFGCPASEELGSSEEYQAAWFEAAFDAIRADDQVVAAFVFEFGNWSDELVELDYGEAFAAEPELGWLFDRLGQWVGTSGLIRPDATTRPAWEVYLANLGG